MYHLNRTIPLCLLILLVAMPALAADQPQWGERYTRNMVSEEKNLPASLGLRIGQPWDDGISKLVAMSGEVNALARQLTDDMIRKLIERDAVIGIVLYNRFLDADW